MSRYKMINEQLKELEKEYRWYAHLAEENYEKWQPRALAIKREMWALEDELYEISEESEAFWNDMN